MAKRKSRWSISDCTRIIKENKDLTCWFSGEFSMDEMWGMLRYRMQFGEAETAVIVAALIKAGAVLK